MRSNFVNIVLAIGVVFCLYTTWSSATAPEAFAEQLGLKILNAGGVNEIRSQYAGFFFFVALVCVASLIGMLPRATACIVLGTLFGGLFIGRLASLFANGSIQGYGRTILTLYAIDGVGVALAATAFMLDKANPR